MPPLPTGPRRSYLSSMRFFPIEQITPFGRSRRASAAKSSRISPLASLECWITVYPPKVKGGRHLGNGSVTRPPTCEIVTPAGAHAVGSDRASRRDKLVAWPKEQGFRNGRNAARNGSRGRRALLAPTVAPPSPCQKARLCRT